MGLRNKQLIKHLSRVMSWWLLTLFVWQNESANCASSPTFTQKDSVYTSTHAGVMLFYIWNIFFAFIYLNGTQHIIQQSCCISNSIKRKKNKMCVVNLMTSIQTKCGPNNIAVFSGSLLYKHTWCTETSSVQSACKHPQEPPGAVPFAVLVFFLP